MSGDLYDAARPARDAMQMELVRICAGREVAAPELAGQRLANHLNALIGAFVTTSGVPSADVIRSVHLALGAVLATTASNLRVATRTGPQDLRASGQVTLQQVTQRMSLCLQMEEAGLSDGATPMAIDAEGRLAPKPFNLSEMMKGEGR